MIRFDEKTHRYYDGEKELISVSALMRKHGLSPDYSAVRSDVLQKKAERGSLIHKEIETYIKTGEIGFTEECAGYWRYIEENGLTELASEKIVYNDICAGTVDLILKDDKGDLIIADIKTTAQLHADAVSWQLSIYNYLYGWKADKAKAFHFDANSKLNVVNIPFKPYEEIVKLFDAEKAGEIYKPYGAVAPINLKTIAQIETLEIFIAKLDARKKKYEQDRDELKAALLAEMEEKGVKTFETDNIRLTYVAPSTRAVIDSARLKKELPEIAEQYTKTSETKASLRITKKEQ